MPPEPALSVPLPVPAPEPPAANLLWELRAFFPISGSCSPPWATFQEVLLPLFGAVLPWHDVATGTRVAGGDSRFGSGSSWLRPPSLLFCNPKGERKKKKLGSLFLG